MEYYAKAFLDPDHPGRDEVILTVIEYVGPSIINSLPDSEKYRKKPEVVIAMLRRNQELKKLGIDLDEIVDILVNSRIKEAKEIVGGIEPTKTGMEYVTAEMAVEQAGKTNSNKDEKPGEEYGDK